MMWDEFDQQDFGYENEDTEREEQDSYLNFDIFSALSKLKVTSNSFLFPHRNYYYYLSTLSLFYAFDFAL